MSTVCTRVLEELSCLAQAYRALRTLSRLFKISYCFPLTLTGFQEKEWQDD